MSEPTTQPEPIKLKKCPSCEQEIADTEKVCPKCSEDFEELDAEIARLEKLEKIRNARKPAPAPAPTPTPTPTAKKKKGSLFSSLARKKEKK